MDILNNLAASKVEMKSLLGTEQQRDSAPPITYSVTWIMAVIDCRTENELNSSVLFARAKEHTCASSMHGKVFSETAKQKLKKLSHFQYAFCSRSGFTKAIFLNSLSSENLPTIQNSGTSEASFIHRRCALFLPCMYTLSKLLESTGIHINESRISPLFL